MKTVTKQQAVERFDIIGDLAHAAKPSSSHTAVNRWIKLVPALKPEARQICGGLQGPAQPHFAEAHSRGIRSPLSVAPLKTYSDTSYLVALYVPNDHTAAALRYRAPCGRTPMILFTPTSPAGDADDRASMFLRRLNPRH